MLKRTTLFAEEETLDELKRLARQEGKSFSEVTREAMQAFLKQRHSRRPLASLIGLGNSGGMNLSERVDELLWEDTRHSRRHKKHKKAS